MINAKTPHTPEEHNKIIYIPNNEMCPDCKNPNGEFIEGMHTQQQQQQLVSTRPHINK